MKQEGWLELVKGYDCEMHYRPRKANWVADTLSQKATATIMSLHEVPKPLQAYLCSLEMEIVMGQCPRSPYSWLYWKELRDSTTRPLLHKA